MLKLKCQYLATWCEDLTHWKDPDSGKVEGGSRRGQQRMRCSECITDSMHKRLSKLWELVIDRQALCAGIHRVAKSQTWLSNWTELNWFILQGSSHFCTLILFLHSLKYPAAAAAAKSLQSCPTLCDPIDGSPPGSSVPGILQQEHWSGLPFPSPMHESEKWKWSRSVVSDSSDPMDCSLAGSSIHGIF